MKIKLLFLLMLLTAAGIAGWMAFKKFRAPVLSLIEQTIPAAAVLSKKTVTKTNLPPFESALLERLGELELSARACTVNHTDSGTTMQVALPRGKPVEWLVWHISQATRGTPYVLRDCLFNEKTESGYLLFKNRKTSRPVRVTFKLATRFLSSTARIALIVEMATPEAYNQLMELCSITEPLTLALVPGDTQANGAAQIAAAHHKETFIYLPLEANNKVSARYSGRLVLIHYTADRINDLIANAVKNIPGSRGIINLFGSRACEDSRIMTIIVTAAKKHRLCFVDSRTTTRSVAGTVAAELKIPFAAVDEQITGESVAAITRELDACAVRAQKSGQIIVLCRGSRVLVAALRKELPRLKQNGVVPVFASALCSSSSSSKESKSR